MIHSSWELTDCCMTHKVSITTSVYFLSPLWLVLVVGLSQARWVGTEAPGVSLGLQYSTENFVK